MTDTIHRAAVENPGAESPRADLRALADAVETGALELADVATGISGRADPGRRGEQRLTSGQVLSDVTELAGVDPAYVLVQPVFPRDDAQTRFFTALHLGRLLPGDGRAEDARATLARIWTAGQSSTPVS